MSSYIKNLAPALLLAALAVSGVGCKEDTIIKAGITPTTDNIYTNNAIGDTLTILAKTVYDDSISTSFTSSSVSSIHGLGTLNDDYFGRTNWGIYLQVVPPAANLSLPTVDSAVLILPYTGISWGDSTQNVSESFTVYPVTEYMDDSINYYSNYSVPYDAANPVSASTSVNLYNLKDSVKVANANRAPHMRIKLSQSFKDLLVTEAKNSADNPTFVSKIKGIYIVATDTNNSTIRRVPYVFITGSGDYGRSAIALYYQDNGNTSPDSVRTSFLNFIAGDCAHYNKITRNYTTTIKNAFSSTALSDSVVFLQNEPGAAIDIRIPNLKNLPVGIINKAQLVITQVRHSLDKIEQFYEPARIYPVGVDANGKAYTLLDREPLTSSSPLDFIDGTRRVTTLPGGITVTQYYINIPREVQKAIVNKYDELHLRINGTVTYPGAYRLIAGGKQSNNNYKIRLNIVYSKIN